jgi:hypothetical protein
MAALADDVRALAPGVQGQADALDGLVAAHCHPRRVPANYCLNV